MEPIDPTEDMEKQPWLRFLPDFWLLPTWARVLTFVLDLMLGPLVFDSCMESCVDPQGAEPVRPACG